MSQEKSQLENMTLPSQDGGVAKKETPRILPPGFSLGQQLTTKGKPTPRAEALKYSLPSYQSGINRAEQEEKEKKASMEREGMNYDLYLLIKEKLVPDFQEKLNKNISDYDILKESGLFELIEKDPNLCTPNPKDIQFIADNLKEFFPKVGENKYSKLGIFLNSFIHAYFNSIPKEKREDLRLFLANTEKLDYIGAKLSFGSLKIKEARYGFGYQTHGCAALEAQKAGDYAGGGAFENARIIVKEAEFGFGSNAHGSAILEAEEVGDCVGQNSYENAQITVKRAGDAVGTGIHGDAIITITEKYASIGNANGAAKNSNCKIILPNGEILMPRNAV